MGRYVPERMLEKYLDWLKEIVSLSSPCQNLQKKKIVLHMIDHCNFISVYLFP